MLTNRGHNETIAVNQHRDYLCLSYSWFRSRLKDGPGGTWGDSYNNSTYCSALRRSANDRRTEAGRVDLGLPLGSGEEHAMVVSAEEGRGGHGKINHGQNTAFGEDLLVSL